MRGMRYLVLWEQRNAEDAEYWPARRTNIYYAYGGGKDEPDHATAIKVALATVANHGPNAPFEPKIGDWCIVFPLASGAPKWFRFESAEHDVVPVEHPETDFLDGRV